MPRGGHPNSGFRKGNKCACRADKLSIEEVKKRKRDRAREYRKTHPHDPARRRIDYMERKSRLCLVKNLCSKPVSKIVKLLNVSNVVNHSIL
jgi:hypothetical protein